MPYLFGIVLCFTFLATINFWHKTRGDREIARKRRHEVHALKLKEKKDAEEYLAALKKKQEDEGKVCSRGWHPFTKWEDVPNDFHLQTRYCKICGLRDSRRY